MKRNWLIMAVLFAALTLAAGCMKQKKQGEASAAPAPAAASAAAPVELHDAGPPGDPVAGLKVYDKVCKACHQADGKGMGGALAANFIDEKERLQKPDSVLLKSIAEGIKGKKAIMPPQKDALSEQERKDALAYIRQKFGG